MTVKKLALVCGKGTIKRKPYKRLSSYGKIVKVPASCIRTTGVLGQKRGVIVGKILAVKKRMHNIASKKFGHLKCSAGLIERIGYYKKPVTRKVKKTGKIVHVKGAWVKPKCIKSRGAIRGVKGKAVIPYLFKGTLGKYGYRNVVKLSITQRHSALKKALAHTPALSVYRKLVAISTLQKNTNPKISKIFRNDANWVKTTKQYKLRAGRP